MNRVSVVLTRMVRTVLGQWLVVASAIPETNTSPRIGAPEVPHRVAIVLQRYKPAVARKIDGGISFYDDKFNSSLLSGSSIAIEGELGLNTYIFK